MYYIFTKQPLGALGIVRPCCYAMVYPEGTAEVYVKDMTTGVGSLVWRQHYLTQDEAVNEADNHLYVVESALNKLHPPVLKTPSLPKFLVHVTYTEKMLGEVVVKAVDKHAAEALVKHTYDMGDLDTTDFGLNDSSIDVTLVEPLSEGDPRSADYPGEEDEE